MKRVLQYEESYGDICIVLLFKRAKLLVFYTTFILDIWPWKMSCLHLNSIWNPAGNSHFQWQMLAFGCSPWVVGLTPSSTAGHLYISPTFMYLCPAFSATHFTGNWLCASPYKLHAFDGQTPLKHMQPAVAGSLRSSDGKGQLTEACCLEWDICEQDALSWDPCFVYLHFWQWDFVLTQCNQTLLVVFFIHL